MSIKPTQTALTGAVLSALVAIIPPQSANAAACTPNGAGDYVVDNNCDAIPATTPASSSSTPFTHIQVNQLQNNALTIGNLDVTHQSTQATNILNVASSRDHTGGTITMGNIKANLGNQQISSVIYAQGGVKVTAQDIDATLQSNGVSAGFAGSANTYAILAQGNGAPVGSVSEVTIENMNLTKHAQDGGFGFSAITNAALRAIQASDGSGNPTGGAGKIVVKQNLNATLSGDLIQGIHASGSSTNAMGVEAVSTIALNNANLLVINNATSVHTPLSAAIMVGKPLGLTDPWRGTPRDVGSGKGLVTVNGTLNIDASKLHQSADAIRLFHDGSKLEATGETNVLASRSAISIGSPYDSTVGTKTHDASDISVSLNNATLNTNGTDASLIKIYNNQTNTNVSISGDSSLLLAPQKGWLLEVGNDASDAGKDTTFTLAGGQHFGLVHKHADGHNLTVNLSDGAIWNLKPKDTERTSTFTTLNIGADAALDATNALAPNMDKTVTMHNGHSMTLSGSVEESQLGADQTFTLKGNVTNAGIINLFDPAENLTAHLPTYTNTLIIDGNYEGKDGSTIYMNTGWRHESGSGDGISKSDLLRITGKATGTTKVIPKVYDDEPHKQDNIITGGADKTSSERNSVPVIIVEQNDDGSHFSGTAKIKNSSKETQLTSRDNGSGGREYYWTLEASSSSALPPTSGPTTPAPTPAPTPTPVTPPPVTPPPVTPPPVTPPVVTPPVVTPPVTPVTPVTPVVPVTPVAPPTVPAPALYDATASAYAQLAVANLETSLQHLGTLHERRGENQVLHLDYPTKPRAQTWGRIFGHELKLEGKERFGLKSALRGVQIGHDFMIGETEQGTRHLTGAYLSYSRDKARYHDRFRAEHGFISDDSFTGNANHKAVSVGVTHTRYTPEGAYLDSVMQYSWINSHAKSRENVQAKQKGKALSLSVEAGKAYALREYEQSALFIEPQAQLTYQHLRLEDGYDVIRHVYGDTHHGLRGRVGARLLHRGKQTSSEARPTEWYLNANIVHDFKHPTAVQIGSDTVGEKHARTWFELGIGAQSALSQNSYWYLDARYEKSFKNSPKRQGIRAQIGYKYTWQ